METDKRTRFLRVYCNLPLGIRKEIIWVLDQEGPVTWNVAYFEVKNNTPISNEILEGLDRLEII